PAANPMLQTALRGRFSRHRFDGVAEFTENTLEARRVVAVAPRGFIPLPAGPGQRFARRESSRAVADPNWFTIAAPSTNRFFQSAVSGSALPGRSRLARNVRIAMNPRGKEAVLRPRPACGTRQASRISHDADVPSLHGLAAGNGLAGRDDSARRRGRPRPAQGVRAGAGVRLRQEQETAPRLPAAGSLRSAL